MGEKRNQEEASDHLMFANFFRRTTLIACARSLRTACLAFVLCCAVLLSPYGSVAEESDTASGKAIVKDGPLQVHSGLSARSKVVKSLSNGTAGHGRDRGNRDGNIQWRVVWHH